MKNVVTIIIIIIIVSAGSFYVGYYYSPDKTVIVKEKVYVNVIKKIPAKMTDDEKNIDLECFYTSDFLLDIEKINGKGNYLMSSKLCARRATREINIPAGEKGNFKLYFGITLGTVATAGLIYTAYRVFK